MSGGVTGGGGVDRQLKADTIGAPDPVAPKGAETGVDEVEGKAVVNEARMRGSAQAGQLALMARLLDAEEKGNATGTPLPTGTSGVQAAPADDDGGFVFDMSKMPDMSDTHGKRYTTVDRETFLKEIKEHPEDVNGELARLATADPPTAYLEAMEWLRYSPNEALNLLPSLKYTQGAGAGRVQGDMILMLRGEAQDKATPGRNQITHEAVTKATMTFLQSNPIGFLGYLEGRPSLQGEVPAILQSVLEKGGSGDKVVGEALAALSTEAARAADAAGKAKAGSPEAAAAERTAIDHAQTLGTLLFHVEEALQDVAKGAKDRIGRENMIMGYAMDAMEKVVSTVPGAGGPTKAVFGLLKKQLDKRMGEVDKHAKEGRTAMVNIMLKTFEAVNDPLGSRSNKDPSYKTAYRIYKDNVTEGRKDTQELDGR